jgi:DNA-binding transcriptional ArsR family regulator
MLNGMVERLDATFHALADATRRGMLARLAGGEQSVGALAAPFAMSFAGAAKHVQVLERAGLISRRRVGRQHLCRLQPQALAEADAWLRQWAALWDDRLDRLQALVETAHQRRTAPEREHGT